MSVALSSAYAAIRVELSGTAEPIDRAYTPFPGPQAAFDAATEGEVLFGGAKGPGKSHALLYKPLRWVHRASFKALFLRVDFPSLQENMDRAHAVFPRFGAVWNERDRRWTFPSGARYEFGYAESLKDIRRYQGREPTWVGYDEIGQLADELVWATMIAELRSPDPTLLTQACGSANPGGPGEPWLMTRFVKPCGEDGSRIYVDPAEPTIRRRFIPARVTDNPIYANSETYMAKLRTLPARQRQQLLEGKWGIGEGRGLDELDERHIIPAFAVPQHWTVWGAFDWGFGHPFYFGWFALSEEGTVYLIDSVHGHRMLPWEQAERIQARAPERARVRVYAGHDCWNERRAMGENTPTIADTFKGYGIHLVRANTDRVQGLNNLREYIKWQGPDGTVWDPKFRIMDTPGNRRTFDVLQSMMLDPTNPEDVKKRDANPETGEGGDDPYDGVRYGLAARYLRTKPKDPGEIRVNDPAVLAAEADRSRRLAPRLQRRHRPLTDGGDHSGY